MSTTRREDVKQPTGDKTRWVCMPCFLMNPKAGGVVTVHGDPVPPVWCPWCGDAMDDAEEQLTDEELGLVDW